MLSRTTSAARLGVRWLRVAVAALVVVAAPRALPATSIDNVAGLSYVDAPGRPSMLSTSNVVHAVVATQSTLVVAGSASPAAPVQNGDLTISLDALSTGRNLDGVAVTIDGAPATVVLLNDPIPPNTALSSAVANAGAVTLYHHRGDPAGRYATNAGDLSTVDIVAFAQPTLVAGASLGGRLVLHIAPNASGTITDVASLSYTDAGAAHEAPSNTMRLALPALRSTIDFFGTPGFVRPVHAFSVGRSLYLQLNAAACNADANVAETRQITVSSTVGGDAKVATLVETGPNTGIFRSVAPLATTDDRATLASHPAMLYLAKEDAIKAAPIGCGADAEIPSLLVDPAGIVFDSRSNAPVANAVVSLIDVTGAGNGGRPGAAAVVYGYDGVTLAPSTLTTGADGAFTFPLVAPSMYRVTIAPPPGYAAPSVVAPAALPTGHVIDPSGSYGGTFRVIDDLVLIDVPLDALPTSGLFVEKRASKSVAEIGDFVDYSVVVKNASTAPLASTTLHDRLPRGFSYQAGTTRVDGRKASDPVGTSTLDFAVGTIAATQQVTITYRVRIGPGARGGDGINRAYATTGVSQSNTGAATVLLSDGGVFSDRGYLVGKVYADCNRNGVQDDGEVGIPDVRVVLEDGTSALTDEEGKYSLYGLVPRTHVAKIDATTLVDGAVLETLDSRNAGDGASRFVDLKNGELHRGDFAVAGCTPAMRDAIDARRRAVVRTSEAGMAAKALLSASSTTAIDPRTLPASGTLDARGIVGRNGIGATADASSTAGRMERALGRVDDAPVAAKASGDAASEAGVAASFDALDATLGFVDLEDGAVLPAAQATIRTKGPANVAWSLSVGGRRVDAKQIGRRDVVANRNLAVVEYVGVDLAAGVNTLELVATDDFGNVRDRRTIAVRAPGRLARVVIDVPAEAKADGRTVVPVRIRLLDADDVPVVARTPITFDASAGQWIGRDLDPREPGIQRFVEGGVLDAELVAPAEPGRTTLFAAVGTVKGDATLTFVPDLRPLIAVGVIEGAFDLRRLGGGLVAAQSGDVFEREIRNVSREFDGERASAAARGALYLKGKVLGETLLTLAYDSDKPQRERLFRDIQPDQFYPVYGDSSVKGFDAQSTSRLYVRIDRGLSYVLYGDFTTQTDDPARPLTQYNRALNGAKTRAEAGPLRVDAFAAYTDTQQVVEEIRGNGTSGPYTLARTNAVVNSEQIHLLTRDRNQPAIVVKDVPLARFTDYEIEPFTGRLLFKAPIPSVDADLNPISLRVTYEVATGGQKFWVGGVDAKVKVGEQADVGAVYIRDTDPSNRATLRGVNGSVKVGEKGLLTGEVAETDSDLYGLGKGRRFEYRQDDATLQARVYGGKTDASFNNPSALLSQGRSEYGAKVGLRLNEQDRLIVEGIRSQDAVTGGARTGVLARVERTFADNVKLELGVRHANETVAPAQSTSLGAQGSDGANRFNSLRTKLTLPVPYVRDASAYLEYERAVGQGNRQLAAVGGSYQMGNGGKLYARHEFVSSLSGAYDLNTTQRLHTTVVGVDSDYMKDGHLFNEYRVGDAIDGRSAEAAIGLRNLWRIADGVGVTTTAENIKPMGGPTDGRSTALTGAVDYTASENWKGSARAEHRSASASDSWLVTAGGAYRLNAETTLLGKAIWSTLDNTVATTGSPGQRRIARGQLGAAYRPVDTNVWNALARIEMKREQDDTLVDTPTDEIATIVSAHVNVSPTPDLSFAGRYGLKRATDRSNGLESRSTTQLLGGRVIKDLDERWDVGVNAYVLATDHMKTRTFALGLEAGYRVATNLWVSVGYNVSGFKDRDLAAEEYTQRGAYLRMRYKFDENVFASKAKS